MRWPWSKRPRGHEATDGFSLQTPLLYWSKDDPWTIGDSVQGLFASGATGSGKTTGVGCQLALAFLQAGFGGLVCTAKKDEVALWHSYCRRTSRLGDLVVFGSGESGRFNFLEEEATRPGEGAGLTENIVNLLATVMEVAERGLGAGGGGRESEPYWRLAAKQLSRNLTDLCLMATGRVSVPDLYRLVTSAPTSLEFVASESWRRNSACCRALAEADARVTDPAQRRDLELVADYFLAEFPALSDKTRSVIVSTFTSMIDVLNRGLLRTLFCEGTNIRPSMVEEGKIILLALPVKEYGYVGQIAQVLFKAAFQRSIERRDVVRSPRPVFLWADEAQHFVTSGDAMFQTTCRSARVATVMLTQSLSVFQAALGGGDKARAETAALLANLNSKVFHCNSDPQTNEWGSQLIGRTRQAFLNSSSSYADQDWVSAALGLPLAGQGTAGLSEAYEHELQTVAFSLLRTGGPDNGMLIDAIVYQNGRRFRASGKNHLHVTFRQVP